VGTLTYADIRQQRAIFGEPSYCIDRIQEMRETLGIQQLMGWMNIGGMPHEKVQQSMRLFADRVLPAIS
jgi:alkanesulfonate monooxygenase SsuD/methylene tetrahydromethanopterin reductase-like flavin-dependent oxidoreductase (luciferase family)